MTKCITATIKHIANLLLKMINDKTHAANKKVPIHQSVN